MYHVELRRFPHVAHAFNLSESELRARILDGWRTRRTIEFGDRRWEPEQTRLRILEGPELAPAELAMGRGWGAAQRRGGDVTERLLASAPMLSATTTTPDQSLADALLARAQQPLQLNDAWRFVHEHRPQWGAGRCLTSAEGALGLLLEQGLASLVWREQTPSAEQPSLEQARALLRDPDTWGEAGPAVVITDAGRAALGSRQV